MGAENPVNWLIELSDEDTKSSIDGLVLVNGFRALDLPPEQYAIMEKRKVPGAFGLFRGAPEQSVSKRTGRPSESRL